MKKLISFLLVMAMAITAFSGCGKSESKGDSSKISIVTTIFPEYDWVREITKGNDNVEISMLLDKGVDLHSFQPTAEDIVKVSSCDVFIYVGGESDQWVEDALKEATNKDMVVINLLDVLGDSVKEEEIIEGMEAEEEEEGEGEEGEDGEEGPEYDEHVWLSLKNAKTLCLRISEELGKLDSANKTLYENNAKEYINSLDELDKKYEAAAKEAKTKTVLFGDRFPFRYLVDDYGLDYYAAFVGCSAESEASFETISFLAGKVDQLKLSAICQIESSNGKIAETIKSTTKDKNQQILTFDSMQSVTAKDVEAGEKYLKIMERNLEAFQEAIK
ncbi:MAG: metal ABC transporter substrate-binding protein [Agathobacter sp.]|nr:metal ABC transporter substrate-binding protein [Agathobacter sp.]